MSWFDFGTSQLFMAIACSKLIIKTLQQGVKYVPSEQLSHKNDANAVVLVSLLFILNTIHTLL